MPQTLPILPNLGPLPISQPGGRRESVALKTRTVADASGLAIDRGGASGTGSDRTFFENNFVAQRQILLGLLRWWEQGLQAGLSFQQGDPTKMLAHLQAADEAIKTVRAGQALASRGKWKHWYSGDRKMNRARIEKLTQQSIAATESLPGGEHSSKPSKTSLRRSPRYDVLSRNVHPGPLASSDRRDPSWQRRFRVGDAERAGRTRASTAGSFTTRVRASGNRPVNGPQRVGRDVVVVDRVVGAAEAGCGSARIRGLRSHCRRSAGGCQGAG